MQSLFQQLLGLNVDVFGFNLTPLHVIFFGFLISVLKILFGGEKK